ncbi:MAG: hypothetical protein HY894_09390 [Deltaproteobacteria bacterium]|nr:hypothetical protein [Deltaproteobacteria bacterium]
MAERLERGAAADAPIGAWLKAGCAAGFAGGLAEVAFMGIYSALGGISGGTMLRLITNTFTSASFAFGPAGAFDGLVIHLILSALIGVAFGVLQCLLHRARAAVSYPILVSSGAALLAGIWAFNFFVLLPVINPAFTVYVPLAPAFFSKLSFGLTLAVTGALVDAARPRVRAGTFAIGKADGRA